MTLAAGSKLGPYEIVAPLGAGGMGEVFRARDTRLGRDVAIKVLPQKFSDRPELRERFEREARTISALNHARICTIYDVGHQDELQFLVMELLEGQTLAERIQKGPLPLRDTLRIGMEICEALDAAHRAGIVHRDLKPANVMLTASGAKLMDFGLAKASAAANVSGTATTAPLLSAAETISGPSPFSPLTSAGQIVGTIQYMSPEQIEGKEADARSDIFALGAVLYEMATGKRPFNGKSQISLATAILEKDPEPIRTLQPTLPVSLDRVINTCLQKNPDDRFQSARDVRLELKWIPETTAPPISPTSKQGPARSILPWALAAAAILAAVVVYFVASRKSPLPRYRMVSFRSGTLQNARFSHDGQTIVFSGEWEGSPPRVSTTRVGAPESRALDIPSATLASISSSDHVAVLEGCEPMFLFDCGGTLATFDLAGGAPREIASHVAFADWSPKKEQLAIVVDEPNSARIEFPPGRVLYQQNSGWLGHPRFSPDGTLIAFPNHPIDSDDGSIDTVDLQGKHTVISDGWVSIEGVAWRPDGKEIWFAGTLTTAGWADAIHAVTLSGKDRIVLSMPWVRLLDVSSDGRVLLAYQDWRRIMMGKFPGDASEHPYSWLDDTNATAITDDGGALSFVESGEVYYIAQDRQAYYRKTDGSPAVSLGVGQAVVSPDGKFILTYGRKRPLTLGSVGVGTSKVLPTPGLTIVDHVAWSDDNRQIVYEGLAAGKDWNVYTQKSDGSSSPEMIAGKGRDAFPVLSPDGQLVAMRDVEKGLVLIRLQQHETVSVKGSVQDEHPVRFFDQGRSLLTAEVTGKGTAITAIDLATGRRTPFRQLTTRMVVGSQNMVLTPDLKYYAYAAPDYFSDLYLVENLK
jgi:serine/threonine protein kinase/Tol biopolymer transport system component